MCNGEGIPTEFKMDKGINYNHILMKKYYEVNDKIKKF